MSVIKQLLALQEKDCQIRDLQRESKDIPKRKQDEQARLKEHKEVLQKAEDALKAKLAEIKRIEMEDASRREKIAKLRTQQLEIKTNKEFKALEEEIKVILNGISGLDDQQLVLMEEQELLKVNIQEKKKALTDEDGAVQKDVALLDQRLAQIQGEIKVFETERIERSKGVDAKWLRRYEEIFGRKDKALVRIEDGVCGGCHMTLPPYIIHGAKKVDSMVVCDFCGRMLY